MDSYFIDDANIFLDQSIDSISLPNQYINIRGEDDNDMLVESLVEGVQLGIQNMIISRKVASVPTDKNIQFCIPEDKFINKFESRCN